METQISHEIPKQLFKQHKFISEYPYLLCHLLDVNGKHYDKEYAEFYKNYINGCSYSILDNAAFELGDSYDSNILYQIGQEYKPTHLVLPDALHNADLTKERARDYINKFGPISIPKFIGVVQGKSYEEFVDMYKFYFSLPQVEIIALPFDLFTEEQYNQLAYPFGDYKTHRVEIAQRFINDGIVSKEKPLHLLGCATPREFTMYNSETRKYIKSVDTSAPIIYGWNKIKFDETGVSDSVSKPKDKLAENLDIKLDKEQLQIIGHNVKQFKTNLFNTK